MITRISTFQERYLLPSASLSSPGPPVTRILFILPKMTSNTLASFLQASKYYEIASLTVLLYDIALTFSTEVDKIWRQKHSSLTILWFLNRWVFLLAIIPLYVAYLETTWSEEMCARFFRYPGYVATAQRAVVGAVFVIRTYCVYAGSKFVAIGLSSLVLLDCALKLVAVQKWSIPLLLPSDVGGCYPGVPSGRGTLFILYYLGETLMDTAVFALTFYRSYLTYWKSRNFGRMRLWEVILKDGILYFLVMMSSNNLSIVFFQTIPMDLRYINEAFRTVTSVLVSRLILNLRVVASHSDIYASTEMLYSSWIPQNQISMNLVGNIANDVEAIRFREPQSDRSCTTSNSRVV